MSCSTPAEKQASLIVPSDAEPRVLSDLSELIDSMTYIPLEEPVEVPEQKLEAFERNGFTVVEWGGSEIEKDD